MDSNLLKTKSIEQLVDDVEKGKHLKRTLTAFDLTLLGIGAIIGTGIFVLTGTAAANQAGPAITISYMTAGLACAFAALCYAEFAAMIPISGSAYAYAYATLGEIIAWTIGWDLILEYAVGSMTVVDRVERLLPAHPGRLRLAPAGVDVRGPGHHARRGDQPPRGADRAGDHRPAGGRHPRERALQRHHGGDQAGRGALLPASPASSS